MWVTLQLPETKSTSTAATSSLAAQAMNGQHVGNYGFGFRRLPRPPSREEGRLRRRLLQDLPARPRALTGLPNLRL